MSTNSKLAAFTSPRSFPTNLNRSHHSSESSISILAHTRASSGADFQRSVRIRRAQDRSRRTIVSSTARLPVASRNRSSTQYPIIICRSIRLSLARWYVMALHELIDRDGHARLFDHQNLLAWR